MPLELPVTTATAFEDAMHLNKTYLVLKHVSKIQAGKGLRKREFAFLLMRIQISTTAKVKDYPKH